MSIFNVAKNGQDKDIFDGSQAKAWLTAAYALKRTKASDTIILDDGIYDEALRNSIPSGTAGNPTTIKALHPKKAILRPTDGRHYVVELTRGQKWIVIDGIDANAEGVYYGSYYIKEDAVEISDIVLSNGVARGGIYDGKYGPVGIAVSGTRLQILNMESFDHFNDSGSDGLDGYGIYFSARNSIVKGCHFYDCGRYAFHQYSGAGGLDNNTITENVMDGSKQTYYPAVILSGGKDNRFFKNVVIGSAVNAGIEARYGETGTVISENEIRNSAQEAVRIHGDVSKIQVINNNFNGNHPDEVVTVANDTLIYGNTVGPIIPPVIPPVIPPIVPPVTPTKKKYKFTSVGGGFTSTGEITLEEIP